MTTLSRKKQVLPVKLTEAEIGVEGIRLANLLQKHGEFLTQTATVKKGLKEQEEAIQADIDRVANTIRTGVTDRPVEVEMRADWERGVLDVFRCDTDTPITSRRLTDDERQREMVLETEAKDAEFEEKALELPKVDISGLSQEPPGEEPPEPTAAA